MRILIAEDDPVSALVLRRVLEDLLHDVDHAASGHEAWKLAQTSPYDVIVSDWMMPGVDGLELCRLTRSRLEGAYTYFILLSSKSEREARIEAVAAGVDDFLAKPVDTAELEARLTTARRILNMQDELRTRSAKLSQTTGYLETANRRFSDLFMGLPVPSITFDTEGRIAEWNRAAQSLFDLDADEVWQRQAVEVFADPDDLEWAESLVQRSIGGQCIENEERTVHRPDGSPRYVLYSTFPLKNNAGRIIGVVCTCSDLTAQRNLEKQLAEQLRVANNLNEALEAGKEELALANARLAELATTDGLTGLKNHRTFIEALEPSLAYAKRHREPLSLVLCDIDHFKHFNDAFGHPAGDALLREFAALLSCHSRTEDLVARCGGEEFAILLRNCGRENAIGVAEKLRAVIADHEWDLRKITASFGVQTLVDFEVPSIEAIVESADRALYASKQAGRNRVTHAADLHSVEAGKKAA
ncbi:MAG TPA: diguanylate cyclase [Fimbriimonadaceae bacterium]|nr:diguanylate cyclase [Fimbriimonadaceae bacterium]HRJ95624.1 diguanylate cyclase [Fimbriimonadaceae bacterium]